MACPILYIIDPCHKILIPKFIFSKSVINIAIMLYMPSQFLTALSTITNNSDRRPSLAAGNHFSGVRWLFLWQFFAMGFSGDNKIGTLWKSSFKVKWLCFWSLRQQFVCLTKIHKSISYKSILACLEGIFSVFATNFPKKRSINFPSRIFNRVSCISVHDDNGKFLGVSMKTVSFQV